MSSLQTTIPRKLEYLQKLSKEEQAIGAAVVLAIVAAAVYTSQPVKKVMTTQRVSQKNERTNAFLLHHLCCRTQHRLYLETLLSVSEWNSWYIKK